MSTKKNNKRVSHGEKETLWFKEEKARAGRKGRRKKQQTTAMSSSVGEEEREGIKEKSKSMMLTIREVLPLQEEVAPLLSSKTQG